MELKNSLEVKLPKDFFEIERPNTIPFYVIQIFDILWFNMILRIFLPNTNLYLNC